MIAVAFLLAALAAPNGTKPVPSPTPRAVVLSVRASHLFVDQSTAGPGTVPPEAAAFIRGAPLSPMSPYDWFTSAPQTPGVVGVAQYVARLFYHRGAFDARLRVGLAALSGSITNAAYWGEPLQGTIDPHGGSPALPYTIAFPTHAGQDDASVARFGLLRASFGEERYGWHVQGGFINLEQSDRFVFAPPAVTSVSPSLGETTAESLGPGIASIPSWHTSATSLPLRGLDATYKVRRAQLELTDALLPSLPGTAARLTMGSVVDDLGASGRYSLQIANIANAGAPIATTTFFGENQMLEPGPQGLLFASTLGDQRQTTIGARAFFHPHHGDDATIEFGRSWYNARLVALPGSARFGNYEHIEFVRHFNENRDLGIEYVRFDPRYSTVILPYGIAENIWSVAWSWPGAWLKSTYQSVDNTEVGINRAGFRIHADSTASGFEAHLSYARYEQLVPATLDNMTQTGFVEGFFLPQQNGFGTRGSDRQYAAYLAWHLPANDLALDFVDDELARPATVAYPIDSVDMRYPQIVASITHHFRTGALGVLGYGRYTADGIWATTPVSGIYGTLFAGAQFAVGARSDVLVEVRRFGLLGLPSAPGGSAPTMHGTLLLIEQQLRF